MSEEPITSTAQETPPLTRSAGPPQGERRLGARLIMRCGAALVLAAIGVTLYGLGREIINNQGFSFWPVILGVGLMALAPGLLLYFCARRIYRDGPAIAPGFVLALTGLPVLALGLFILFGPSPRPITGILTVLGAGALMVYGARIIMTARRVSASAN